MLEQMQGIQREAEQLAEHLRQNPPVHVGMTRREVLRVFREQGGLCHPKREAFIHRQNAWVQIAVEFDVVEKGWRPWKDESGEVHIFDERDVVLSVSEPFVAHPTWD